MRVSTAFLAALCAGALASSALAQGWDDAAGGDHRAIAERAVDLHILPAYETLAAQAAALGSPAAACDAAALRGAFHGAYDAWMGAQHIALGPVEADARRFAIVFWPDTKGFVRKSLNRMISSEDSVVDTPEAFAKISVAGRGLSALERLLFDAEFADGFDGAGGAYRCRIAQAIAADLGASANSILEEWRGEDGFRGVLLSAGAEDNAFYLEPEETTRDLFTTLDGGLQSLIDLRLGRPLGAFDRPRPNRAETWRSGRALRNIALSIRALHGLYAAAFAPALPPQDRARVEAGFQRAIELAERAPTPMREAVADPMRRIEIEALQSRLSGLRGQLREHLAPALGVTVGFNSLDGD